MLRAHISLNMRQKILQQILCQKRPIPNQVTPSATTASHFSTQSQSSIIYQKQAILQASLSHVHKYGWTKDAIAQGVYSSNLPLTYMGLVTPLELISYFMTDCNSQLRTYLLLQKKVDNEKNMAWLEEAIRYRLEMVIPFIRSHTWQDGMALGALENTLNTSEELQTLVRLLLPENDLNPLKRMALGGVYIATELHLLGDSSEEYKDTWNFLRERLVEYDQLFSSSFDNYSSIARNSVLPDSNVILGATAVASSLGSAVLSLAVPGVRGVVDQAVSHVGSTVGNANEVDICSKTTSATMKVKNEEKQDQYKDLPPFEADVGLDKKNY